MDRRYKMSDMLHALDQHPVIFNIHEKVRIQTGLMKRYARWLNKEEFWFPAFNLTIMLRGGMDSSRKYDDLNYAYQNMMIRGGGSQL